MTFRLDHFEGPLDLLLHLISRHKIDIYDIPIAQILEQYMAVLDEARTMDMDVAGDFIAMAAQLVYIKSKMLLPRHDAEGDTEDPRAQLVEMLLEYQRIKLAAPYLQQQEQIGRDIFTKPPEPLSAAPRAYRHTPQDLVRTARNLLRRAERRVPPSAKAFAGIVGREAVPVSEKIAQILRQFLAHSKLHLARLLRGAHSRSEAVATFLAVLELSKNRRIHIEGQGEDVSLELVPAGEEDPD